MHIRGAFVTLYLFTVRKVVYGIIELLWIIKAAKVEDCAMIGFALPKFEQKSCAFKVMVKICSTQIF